MQLTLWNLIRDFFVQYIFGGVDSSAQYYGGFVGRFAYNYDGTANDDLFVNYGFTFPLVDNSFAFGEADYVTNVGITMGDWLSTTATIICLTLMVVVLISFLVWLFKFVSGLILLKH